MNNNNLIIIEGHETPIGVCWTFNRLSEINKVIDGLNFYICDVKVKIMDDKTVTEFHCKNKKTLMKKNSDSCWWKQ